MHVLISGKAGLLSIAVMIAAGLSACTKDRDFSVGEDADGQAVEFTAYTASMTKAVPVSASDILGYWDSGNTVFTPGTGIGVFAYYQKAKSNGYPNYFNKNVGAPNFMSNQKVERTALSDKSLVFTYSPAKYWPNNENDLISFFAYAPYDISTAWEDLNIESNLKGDKITRHYELEDNAEDQTDFLWADPVLNVAKPVAAGSIDFSFRHICARIGATCSINVDSDDAYVTVEKIVVRSKFNVSGDIVYRTSSGSSAWEGLERSYHTKDYVLYEVSAGSGQRVTADTLAIGGSDTFLFPFPGTQDVTVTATLTQNNPNGGRFVSEVYHTFTGMELAEGKAYNFFLKITIDPIEIGTVAVTEWALDSESHDIP